MKIKRMTRRKVEAWLYPMRHIFIAMRNGEVDSIGGNAVARISNDDDYVRIEWLVLGFVGLIERVLPGTDCAPLLKVERRLAAGVLMCVEDIDAALALLKSIEKPLMGLSVEAVKGAVRTEQIQIEMDALGVAA